MFQIGEKVVCIDASPARSDCAAAMPLKLTANAVYTVRSLHTEPHLSGYGVRLEELQNPSVIWSDNEEKEWSYASWRFRALADIEDRLANSEREDLSELLSGKPGVGR